MTDLNDKLESLLLEVNLQALDTISISRLLIISNYFIKEQNSNLLNDKTQFIVNRLLSLINKTYIQNLVSDFKLLNLVYVLKIFSSPKEYSKIQEDYICILVNFESLFNLIENENLIKFIWPDQNFKSYIKILSQYTLDDALMREPFLLQQKRIYLIFYLTIRIYDRGEQYKYLHKLLYKTFKKAIKENQEELVFYLYTPLLFSWNGVSQTQNDFKIFNKKIEKRLEKYIKKSILPKYNITSNKPHTKNKKIKVAFIQERLINHSIFRVFYSLMKLLKENPNNKYEFIIYNLDAPEFGGSNKKTVKEIKKIGLKYVNLNKKINFSKSPFYSTVKKSLLIREQILEDNIDILISTCSRPEENFLFTSRTAPKQIFWSHGNYEYDIKEIDQKINNGALAEGFINFDVGMDIEQFHNPDINPELMQQERKKYPKDVFILGSIGRLTKVDNDIYLETIAKVMKKNKNTIYIAAGSGDIQSIQKKVDKLGISDRFYMPGFINPHIYGYIIDFFPDTFPDHQGESLQEFMYKKKDNAYVTLKNKEFMSHHKKEQFQKEKDIVKEIEKKNQVFHEYHTYTKKHYGENFTCVIDNLNLYIKLCNAYIKDEKLRIASNYNHRAYLHAVNSNTHQQLISILDQK